MVYKREEISQADISRQIEICSAIRSEMNLREIKPLAVVNTYGCQQNEADSETLRGYLTTMGFELTNDEQLAEVVIANTCAIREHAEMRVLGNVGALVHAKAKNPNMIVAVCGCMVQQPHMREKIKKSFRVVDLCFGPHELWRFPELLERARNHKGRVFEARPSEGVVAEGLPSARVGKVKAWVSIMYGCNNYCTYCVVPHVRGRERSRAPEDVLREVRELIDAGYKDICLLGQNVNSYGKDLGLGMDFADLIRGINDIPGDFLIRFMTSHPRDATQKLFKAMAECEKCAHHIHLPVQSGNDRVLKAMNRHYDSETYLSLVDMARSYMPDLVLTTDIIVGFPGETADEFEDTLSLVEKVRYEAMFTFIYSARENTPAASMPDPITREEKQVWFDKLIESANRISAEKHSEYMGRKLRVLIDGETKREGFSLSARTSGGRLVYLKGSPEDIGNFVNVEIVGGNSWTLYGEIIY